MNDLRRDVRIAYVNADHWSIAMPVTQELPAFRFLFRDEARRTALVESAIEVVAATVRDPASK